MDFHLAPPPLIPWLIDLLNKYPLGGQILKVIYFMKI
jgi:hypothetical protein